MSTPRTQFIQHIQKAFENHNVKEKCFSTMQSHFESKTVNRLFDDFPQILDEKRISNLCENFKNVIKKISSTNSKIKKGDTIYNNLASLEKEIIQIGYDELLDKNTSQIKSEIIKLLKWENALNMISIPDLICAYIGKLNGDIIIELNKTFNGTHSESFLQVFNCINQHYQTWIKEVLHSKGIKYTTADVSHKGPLVHLSALQKTVITAGFLTGMATLGAVLYMRFFNNGDTSDSGITPQSDLYPKL